MQPAAAGAAIIGMAGQMVVKRMMWRWIWVCGIGIGAIGMAAPARAARWI